MLIFLKQNGEIEFNQRNKQYYEKSVFDNENCKECELLPLCMGACIQKLYEENIKNQNSFESYCYKLNQDEYNINDFVKDTINDYV